MSKRKSICVLLVLVLLLALVPTVAFAASSSSTQDGLTVEITTAKDSYVVGETVDIGVKVTNNNSHSVSNIEVRLSLPPGLQLTSGSDKIVIGTLGANQSSTQTLPAVARESEITGLPGQYTLYTGGRVSWTPAPSGGTWSYDNNYLSMTQSGNAYTFKAIKDGKTSATYTVGNLSHTVSITINKSTLPQTGDNTNIVLPLILLLVSAAMISLMVWKRKKLFAKSTRFFSLLLCFVLLAGVLIPSVSAYAATTNKSFTVQHVVRVDGVQNEIKGYVTYDWDGGATDPQPDTPAVNSVTVTPDTVDATGGIAIDNQQLTATVNATGGASQAVTWSVHDAGTTGSGKVTITADGKLSVAADALAGTAIIRATSVYDTSKYGICTVTIPAPTPTPTTYSLMPLHITGQSTTHGSVSIKLGNPTGNKSGE